MREIRRRRCGFASFYQMQFSIAVIVIVWGCWPLFFFFFLFAINFHLQVQIDLLSAIYCGGEKNEFNLINNLVLIKRNEVWVAGWRKKSLNFGLKVKVSSL